MIVGSYVLDLYCDNEECPTRYGRRQCQYVGTTFTDCASQSRDDGWKLTRDRRRAYCPRCKKPRAERKGT